jgi:hypothetical protein
MKLTKTVIYFKNRSPTKLLLNTTSYESFYKKKSDLFNFRIIELLVYYHNIEIETNPNRQIKSDFRIRQTKLIGYNKGFN